MRGGTGNVVAEYIAQGISIHPPLAGWDALKTFEAFQMIISIHPPLAGWDLGHLGAALLVVISIHPPLAGWDCPR